MEQKGWKIEKDEIGCQPPQGPVLCTNNCGFFGSASTMNLCSQCYRAAVLKRAKASEAAAAISVAHAKQFTPQVSSKPRIEAVSPEAEALTQSGERENLDRALTPSQMPSQPNRCSACSKRIGLTGFKCRCGNVFCSLHRYNDKHNCPYDYRAAAQEAIAEANPVVKADKIDKV